MANVQLNIVTKYDDKGEKNFKGAMGGLANFAKGPGGLAIAGIGASVAAGFAAATVAVVNFSDDVAGSMQTFAAQTGVASDQLDEYKDIALDIFDSNWGDSVDDVAKAMANVKNTTGAANDELKKLTQNALIMRDRFDKDVNESTDAAKVLMDEFGLSSEEAFDFMTSGIQRGLDRSGDFLDTIREYGNQFNEAGFTAEQFFSMMETGTQGGVLGTDKMADAFKEFRIRVLEEGGALEKWFEDVGGDFEKWKEFYDVDSGDLTAAFQDILNNLNAMTDPVERNAQGVAAFGTAWEDLGEQAFLGLDLTKTQLDDLNGAMEEASQSGVTIGEAWEQSMRTLATATAPIGDTIAPLLVEALGGVASFIESAQPIFSQFADTFAVTLQGALKVSADALERIGPAIGLTGENAEASDVLLAALEKTLGLINTTVQALAIGLNVFSRWVEWNSQIRDQLSGILDIINDITAAFTSGFGGGFDLGGPIFEQGEGGLFGKGGLLGWQTGGTFTVGGAGGPDSQLVMFRASPGENVTINQPGQSTGGIPGIDTGRVSGAVQTAAEQIAAKMLRQFEDDLVRELTK